MLKSITGFTLVALLISGGAWAGSSGTAVKTAGPSSEVGTAGSYGRIPLYFIENNGQIDDTVRYYEKGVGHATFFTKDGVYITLTKGSKDKVVAGELLNEAGPYAKQDVSSETVRLSLAGSNKNPEIIAEDRQDAMINYLAGNDQSKWKRDISTFGKVVYKEVYTGIDLRYYGNNGTLEYDVILRPGSDHKDVKFTYEGIKGLKVTETGDLEVALKDDKIVQHKPYIYQEINGKRVEVAGSFKIDGDNEKERFTYGFQVASYDKGHALVIDPVIAYSTHLGGYNIDYGQAITVDAAGSAYITGYTDSTDFPTYAPVIGSYGGHSDVFVTKLNPAGNALVYSTYLGGSGTEYGTGIAVDSTGSAYVVGYTNSANFPMTAPIQGAFAGGFYDGFVTKLNPAGNALIYSTYIGGIDQDTAHDITVNPTGSAYIAGSTRSTNFPTISPRQGTHGGGVSDAFVTKINPAGSAYTYSTYLGGSGADYGISIAIDGSGYAYVAGSTASVDFPTVTPLQGAYGGGIQDAFVAKLNSAGNSMFYSTYLGGSWTDTGMAIAVDGTGSAYLTGNTSSLNFPMASPAQSTHGGGATDVFVAKLAPAGNALTYSTYLGGSNDDQCYGIGLDSLKSAYVAGGTSSLNFPAVLSLQVGPSETFSYSDAFVTKLSPAGNAFVYSTFLGGHDSDSARGLAVDGSGSAYVTGMTLSSVFPTVSPIQTSHVTGFFSDAFVTKINSDLSQIVLSYPVLTGYNADGVNPNVGTASTVFGFKVVYKQNNELAPEYVKVCIDSVCYTMTKDIYAATALKDGKFANGEQYLYNKTNIAAGSHNYYFTASDRIGTAALPSTGTLAGPTVSNLIISTASLPDGFVLTPYSVSLSATGGTAPYVWSAPSGLPAGLTLDSAKGIISGTLSAGGYGFKPCVTDANSYVYCKNLTITVVADTIIPAGSIMINGGAAFTKTTASTLTLSATDNSGTVSQMMFSNDNVIWSAWSNYAASTAWTLTAGQGTKTVYAQFKDTTGNVSTVASDTVQLDITKPAGTVSINSGAASTKATAVTLTLSATDNSGTVSQMRFSNDKATWSAWSAYSAKKAWTLTAGEGTKTVYVQFADTAGNISTNVSDTIMLDQTKPTGTISINSGAASTNSTAVTLSLSASDNSGTVSTMRFSNDNVTWSAWSTYSVTKAWTLTAGAGTKTVYVQFKDAAGNLSTVVNDTILLN